jgi:hypothetical protein
VVDQDQQIFIAYRDDGRDFDNHYLSRFSSDLGTAKALMLPGQRTLTTVKLF